MNIKDKILRLWKFITVDIWRLTDDELTKREVFLYKIIKTFVLTARGFMQENLSLKASALTYSTLLAIVPTLALILSIARGFGFQKIIEDTLLEQIPGQREALQMAFGYVNSYLEYARGGIFVGIGLIILLFSVLSLITNIENIFNDIWQIKQPRSIFQRFIGFLAAIVIIPVFLVVSSGFSIFVSSSFSDTTIGQIIAPVTTFGMKLMPYVLNSALFSLLYIIIPNTKVKIGSAVFAGILAGFAFQFFQLLYINGQIWVSTYNKIYGSFAAVPLLLLWLQLSYLIFLFGANLAFAFQNNQNYDFETDVQKITRRYKDFLYLVIMCIVVRRFEDEKPPITAQEISSEYQIPLRLTNQLVVKLIEAHILTTGTSGDERTITYLPAFDINKMTVGLVLDRIYSLGSENFKVDKENRFSAIWNTLVGLRTELVNEAEKVLIKDLHKGNVDISNEKEITEETA